MNCRLVDSWKIPPNWWCKKIILGAGFYGLFFSHTRGLVMSLWSGVLIWYQVPHKMKLGRETVFLGHLHFDFWLLAYLPTLFWTIDFVRVHYVPCSSICISWLEYNTTADVFPIAWGEVANPLSSYQTKYYKILFKVIAEVLYKESQLELKHLLQYFFGIQITCGDLCFALWSCCP